MNPDGSEGTGQISEKTMENIVNSLQADQIPEQPENQNEINQGRWTDEEHEKFLKALEIYGKDWNLVHDYIGSRTSAQTRSHAQKFFNKLCKKGKVD